MTASAIEAIYVYDQNNETILEHTYFSRPPSARSCLTAYLALPSPRPSVSYHSSLAPATTFATSQHNGLLFLVPSTRENDPLAALTFIGRLVDIFEDFLAAPLTAAKLTSNYDIVAQILAETVDGGSIATTEPNALKETVTTQGWVDKLLGGVGLPSGPAPSLQTSSGSAFGIGGGGGISSGGLGSLRPSPMSNQASGPQVPWRRPNVRHTSNELYVDMIESLHVLLAPSGRPLSARVHGSILFTAKLSGVPDLILNLTAAGGGKSHVGRIFETPAFHPCVRLNRWRDNPGELSFVPPDGKFMLAGYEVNLLPEPTPENGLLTGRSARQLDLPVTLQINKSLGSTGMEFEVRLGITGIGAKGGSGPAAAQIRSLSNRGVGSAPGSGRSTPSLFGTRDIGTSSAPALNDIIVQVPLPPAVRNVSDLRASRGEASFNVGTHIVEWRVGAKEAAGSGVATLRCTVVGPLGEGDEGEAEIPGSYGTTGMGDYDETTDAYQEDEEVQQEQVATQEAPVDEDAKKIRASRAYMPTSASVSFSIKGWLPSGLKVDSLNIDTRRSKGLGDGVKPVKGAKYLTVSRRGIEIRC